MLISYSLANLYGHFYLTIWNLRFDSIVHYSKEYGDFEQMESHFWESKSIWKITIILLWDEHKGVQMTTC